MNLKLFILLILLSTNLYSAVQFDGTNDYVKSNAVVNYNSNILTICFWLKWPQYGDNDKLALESSANYNSNNHTFIIDPNGGSVGVDKGFFSVGIHGSGATDTRLEYITRSTQTIFHFATVIDNSTTVGDVKIFINGIEQATTIGLNSKDFSANFSAQTLNLMSRNGTALFGQGTVDDFRIYNRELNTNEIYSIANSRKRIPITDGLILWWKMDEGLDGATVSDNTTSIRDFSGNGNHGKATNSPLWKSSDWISY